MTQPASGDSSTPTSATVTSAVEEAIQTDLAPSVAVALLAKSDDPSDPSAPAMKCISAGLSAAGDDESVRLQFIFENGTVLPIDVPRDACQALAKSLRKELGED